MSKEPRIQPDEVIAAYKKTGIVPVREEFACKMDGKLCGCPLTALWAANQPDIWRAKRLPKIELEAERWAIHVYGGDYVRSFAGAFDFPGRDCEFADERRIEAHADGNAVARAVREAFPEVANV